MKIWGIHDAQGADDPRPSGCGFYRIVMPFEYLSLHGWDAACASGTPPPEAADADLMVAERLDRPEVQGLWRRMRARHRLVYEVDDDVFNVDPVNAHAYRVYAQSDIQDVVAHCAAVADLVTVTVEPLAEVMRQFNPNVEVIPNFVPAKVLELERPRREHLTIGWTGGASHGMDIAMIAQTVREFMERHPEARLHLQGQDFRKTTGHYHARFTPWEPDPRRYYEKLDFDIGLCPLTGTKFDASKSNLKALEYAALGIPVIASDVEAYRDFVVDGVTGFLVKTQKQWRARLRELAADAGLRENMGAKAKEAARSWTMEENYVRWARAYERLL